ncbi:MAG: PEP-utilizing enzyme, partial [bacterium]
AACEPPSASCGAYESIAALLRDHRGQNLIPWDTAVFRLLYRWLRRYATLREETRYSLLQGWALMRGILLEIGRRETLAGTLPDSEAVFFLEIHEIENPGNAKELRRKVEERIRKFKRDRERPAPPIVHLDALGNELPAPETGAADGHGAYYGIAASAGRATGTARRLESPADALKVRPGDVVIVNHCKPWMSVVFRRASGVAAAGGGVVSHLALAAREFGKPMLVGVHGLRGADIEGRTVEIVAAARRVRILEDG